MKQIVWIIIVVAMVAVFSAKGQSKYIVVDGDSLEYGVDRIRLEGIDAPEYLQDCNDKYGNKYRCGIKSTEYLQSLLQGKISCHHFDKDRYGRHLSECFNGNGLSLNRQMVISGWAVSYGNQYTEEEKIARRAKLGIWQGKFMRPELFRALNRSKDKRNKNKKR